MHKDWSSLAILNSKLLHDAVYHLTKFQADNLKP